MNAAASSLGSHGSSALDQGGAFMAKYLADLQCDHTSASRRWFARLLWRAFPGPSEHEVAQQASRALGVSPRAVTYWLRGQNSAALQYVTATMLIAGLELALGTMAAGEPLGQRDDGSSKCGERSAAHGTTCGAASRR